MFDSRFGPAVADGDPFVDDLFDEVVPGPVRGLGDAGDVWAGSDLSEVEPSTLPPSGLLLDMLDAHPAAAMDDFDAVETMVACERIIARATAVQADAVARLAALRGHGDEGCREAADEVAAALRVSTAAADNRVAFAAALTGRLPATRAALYRGEITAVKARAIWEATVPLDDDDAVRRVEEHVLRRAGDQTPAQLRACLRRAVVKADPDGARRRHQRRKAERRVERDSLDDGMGSLWAYLTAVETCAAYTRLTDVARALKAAGDSRGIDELRADALVAACLGRDPLAGAAGAGTGTAGSHTPTDTGGAAADTAVGASAGTGAGTPGGSGVSAGAAGQAGPSAGQAGPAGTRTGNRAGAGAGIAVRLGVTVGIGTLLGLDDEPGELAGYGPISADIARKLAADATWHRLLTDPPPAPSSTTAAPPTHPRPTSPTSSAPATGPAGSPAANNPPGAATSTTSPPGRTARPRITTWAPCADGTTSSNNIRVGGSTATATAPGPGPHPPAIPTPLPQRPTAPHPSRIRAATRREGTTHSGSRTHSGSQTHPGG